MTDLQASDLRAQHVELFTHNRYDGHNRKPQGLPMRSLGLRRSRRRWRHILRGWVLDYSGA